MASWFLGLSILLWDPSLCPGGRPKLWVLTHAPRAHWIDMRRVQLDGNGSLCHLAEVALYVLPVRDVPECGGL